MSVSVRGISSGIDINGIIEELMQLERQPIRRKEAMIERTEQIADLWREVNSRLNTLKRTLNPLLNELTFTAPVPRSGNEELLQTRVTGTPKQGTYHFNVNQLAARHAVATKPPAAGARISSPEVALNLKGAFYLGTGRELEGLSSLAFGASTESWLSGSIGAGLQAVVDGSESSVYALDLDSLGFAEGYEGAEKIEVYMKSFTSADGQDISSELEAYFASRGWAVDLEQPLFTMEEESPGNWVARAAHGGVFAFLGDHPLGTFGLEANILDSEDEVMAINSFTFDIRNSVDESKLIMIKETDTLNIIANRINAKSFYTGVSASVVMAETGDYRLVLQSEVEGKTGYIQAYDFKPLDAAGEEEYGTDRVLESLHFFDPANSAAGSVYAQTTAGARDALFTLNGLELTRSSNTFRDVISGVEVKLTGTGPVTVEVAPDVDAAIEEIKLFVEAVNEVNSYLRVLQKDKEGPLQGSSDLMRIERQLRSLIHGIVPDIPGSSHLNQPLTFSGTGSGGATATGLYTGTKDYIELTYYASAAEWRFNGERFESGDTADGVRIDIDPAGAPGNLATLRLQVSPASTPLTYYNTPGSIHSNQLMTYSGSGEVTATADGIYTGRDSNIRLLYNATAGYWMYNGSRFTSGGVIDGVTINIDPAGAPSHLASLSINVTAPSDPRSYNSLAAVGIMAADEEGILSVDEAKLRAALADDAASIFKMLAREAPRDAGGRARGPHGVVGQIQNMVDEMLGFNGLVQGRQNYLQREIDRYGQRIEMLERRMEIREQRLVRQFTFMEQYIARIQEQTGLMASFEMMMQNQRDQ